MRREGFLIVLLATCMVTLGGPSTAEARVTGVCSNCHTMHYSQNGGVLPAWGSTGPYQYLLTNTCVGCHSNPSGNTTIVNNTPIVLTSTEPTYPPDGSSSSALAAGNFYWVLHATSRNSDPDTSGHNCLAIPGMTADSHLSQAPGMPDSASGSSCARCHRRIESCTSCHTPAHHADDTGGGVVGASGGWYRFLNSSEHGTASTGVKGIEDSDWEQTVSSSDHNEYNGCNNPYGNDDNSISNDCAGCHYKFHGINYTDTDGTVLADNKSPWFLHPTHLALADTASGAEYHNYNNGNGYNPLAPLARDPDRLATMTTSTSTVYVAYGTADGDQVMCLSCHRAHGSPYPDMLRWDYNTCQAGTPNSNCGCFVCHTQKDN